MKPMAMARNVLQTPMSRRVFLPACAVTLGLPARAAIPGPAGAGADFQWLDQRLAERVRDGIFDGMGLVIGRGPSVLHERHVGASRPDRVLHVASMGKWVAAAVIAAVVDSGRLGWDDPVRKFLPSFGGGLGEARLRQLLSHTAGYPDYQPPERRRDDYATLAESVQHILDLPPVAAPGQRFQYGGLAMQVAGRMAELAAGARFQQLFERCLGGPLGMARSGFSPVSAEPGFSPMLGGSFFTCTQDYARFLMMIAGGGRLGRRRILSEAAVAALEADQVRGASLNRGEYVERARQDLRPDVYGLGQWREEVDDTGRATLLSSPGWAGAYAWWDRRADLWGVVIAKADIDVARSLGYNTFLGSTIYAPMARRAVEEARVPPATRAVPIGPDAWLHVEDSGRGEPVVLLHGHSLDHRQWAPQMAALRDRYRIIRYDLRGYGRSSGLSEGLDFMHVDDLRALLDQLGLPRAHLVGLSLGGFVVTDFLARYPDRVLSATMAGGDLFDVPGPDSPWTELELAQRRQAIAAVRAQGLATVKQAWFEGLVRGGGSGRDRLRQPLWQMIDEWSGWHLTHIEPRLLLGRSAPAALAASRPSAPVLLIRGDRESTGFAIQRWLPQAQTLVIPDCGHVSAMECPEVFNAAVLAHLARAATAG